MERLKRLRAELESRNYEAFLATQKPNQLYFIDHPDPSGIFRSLPYMLITLKESIVFPGVWISNACKDFLTNEEVVINEVGDPMSLTSLLPD